GGGQAGPRPEMRARPRPEVRAGPPPTDRPVRPMIVTPAEFAQLSAQAIREYPFECCGFVLERTTPTPDRLWLPCRNEQNELHRKDPKTYPRDARTAYRIHGQDVINMERLAVKGNYTHR